MTGLIYLIYINAIYWAITTITGRDYYVELFWLMRIVRSGDLTIREPAHFQQQRRHNKRLGDLVDIALIVLPTTDRVSMDSRRASVYNEVVRALDGRATRYDKEG